MMNKEDDQFYRNLPRKDIQALCKGYNLPANRSTSDMAESLIDYFKKLNSSISSEARGSQKASFPLTSEQCPRMTTNFTENAGKDSYGLIFCPRAKSNNIVHSQPGRCNESCYCGDHTPNKESCVSAVNCPKLSHPADAGRLPSSQNRDINFGGCCPKESVGPQSQITSKKVPSPSFEFHVSSDKGLDLVVDLTSRPSDWLREFKNKYEICDNMCHNKSQLFQQIRSTDSAPDKHGREEVVCSPRKEQSFMGPDHSNSKECNNGSGVDVDVSEHLEEDQRLVSSESRMKDANIIKSRVGDSVAIISDGSTSNLTLERQVSKDDNANWKNSNTLNNRNPADTDMKKASLEAEFHCEDEISSPSKNNSFIDLVDSKVANVETDNNDLDSSRKLPDICGNQSVELEEQETNKNITEGEDSDCVDSSLRYSEFDDQSDDSCLILDKLESKKELCRKRAYMDSDNNAEYCSPDPKVLRSTRNHAGKAIPRRSTRLVSK